MCAMEQRTDRHDIALLMLRVIISVIFLAHGAQKLFGMFGGPGLDAVAGSMARNGLKPGMFFAVLGGVSEFGGGLLLLIGLLTPLAALVIAGIMIVAIATVTGGSGFIGARGVGYEYNVLLMVASLALVIAGPGRLSLDHRLGLDWTALRARRGARRDGTELHSRTG